MDSPTAMAGGDEEEEEEEPPSSLSPSPPASSSSSLNAFPSDILYGIFSRLPIKTLHCLRCVCSRWRSLLHCDSDFTSLYHHTHRLDPLLLFRRRPSSAAHFAASCFSARQDGSCSRRRLLFELSISGEPISVLSSHGILCFLTADHLPILYDPVTARVSHLPHSQHLRRDSFAAAAFGLATGEELKVVHLYTVEKFDNYHYESVKEVQCEILTVPIRMLGFSNCSWGSGGWRRLGRCPVDILARKPHALVAGSVWWLVSEKRFNPDGIRIVSFDLEHEKFGLLCFPRECSNRSVECVGLLEIEEKLCLTDRIPWESKMTIWELVDQTTGIWVNKHQIDLAGTAPTSDLQILGHFSNAASGGEILIKTGYKDFVFYDVEDRSFRVIDIEEDEQGELEELQCLLNRKHLL